MRSLSGMLLSVFFLIVPSAGWAQSLDDHGAPTSKDSAMYTLDDIYNRLDTGAAGAKREGAFTEPLAGPAPTGPTLDNIMDKAPAVDGDNGASAADVLTGKTFWGLKSGEWGLKTGNLATQTPDNTTVSQPAGYYEDFSLSTVDTDLAAENIKKDVQIFGVTGTYPLAGVAKTGQATSYGTHDDGDLQKGLSWPTPRFTDNLNGTVTDNLTGLVWLQKANCTDTVGGVSMNLGLLQWGNALTWCNNLADGDCDLIDDSEPGDWRLPNRFEIESLLDLAYRDPPISDDAGTGKWGEGTSSFTGVLSDYYWSSTTVAGSTGHAWRAWLYDGDVGAFDKAYSYHVWPVRDAQ